MNIHKKGIPQINELLAEGEISEVNGYLFPKHFMTAGKAQADKIMSMKGSEKGVIVVGLAKTGNHFFMSLLDALGCDRAEELGVKGGISSIPFEAQPLDAYDKMEEKMAQADKPIILPHCHLYAPMFPQDFKGKIICITRDPRAVAASAYPFLTKISAFNGYFEKYGIKSVEDFAQHDVKGKTYWGDVDEYDQSWRDYAKKNPSVGVLFLKFEDVIKNKPDNIKKLAEFIGITDYNLDDVIENSSIPATIERRKKKFEAANYPFYEMICYRKGETGSWREELSDETKRLYAEKYPNHPVS